MDYFAQEVPHTFPYNSFRETTLAQKYPIEGGRGTPVGILGPVGHEEYTLVPGNRHHDRKLLWRKANRVIAGLVLEHTDQRRRALRRDQLHAHPKPALVHIQRLALVERQLKRRPLRVLLANHLHHASRIEAQRR